MRQKLAEWLAVISGMRKTIVMLILIVVAIAFRVLNYVDGSQFVDLLKGTVIAFFSANSIEHIGETIRTYVSGGKQVQAVQIGDDVAVAIPETPESK